MESGFLESINQTIGNSVVTIPPAFLWVVFGVSLGVFALLSGVLMYHWSKYSFKSKVVKTAKKVYLFGGVVLFIIAGVSIFLMS